MKKGHVTQNTQLLQTDILKTEILFIKALRQLTALRLNSNAMLA